MFEFFLSKLADLNLKIIVNLEKNLNTNKVNSEARNETFKISKAQKFSHPYVTSTILLLKRRLSR